VVEGKTRHKKTLTNFWSQFFSEAARAERKAHMRGLIENAGLVGRSVRPPTRRWAKGRTTLDCLEQSEENEKEMAIKEELPQQ